MYRKNMFVDQKLPNPNYGLRYLTTKINLTEKPLVHLLKPKSIQL